MPPYSPDFNPIEMAFPKLKALLGKVAARTIDELWSVIAFQHLRQRNAGTISRQ
ncbi:hypothetical protein HK439_01155 [Labrenzia aggregata]|uniref:DDE superfamily endonuclease n=1 Tax=Roseibium aggregatum TaxID=187304 RepID=A0A926S4A0_9HYPH|nr:hypothetical protein [Roseibium aggregatum]